MRKLDYCFYIGSAESDGKELCYIKDNQGYLFSKEDLLNIANGILNFVKEYGDNIDEMNLQKKKKAEDEYNEWLSQCRKGKNKKEKQRKNAKIYIMECNGRYKVGMSKLVENRLKQIDNRPFPCEILFKSSDTKYAYEIEQEIHIRLSKKRIKGEWYEMGQDTLSNVKQEIERLIKCYDDGIYTPERLRYVKERLG